MLLIAETTPDTMLVQGDRDAWRAAVGTLQAKGRPALLIEEGLRAAGQAPTVRIWLPRAVAERLVLAAPSEHGG